MTVSLQEELNFINLCKQKGMSSFDCIRSLRKILHVKKIGHMGTLDPLADGVLPIAVGKGTRLIEYLEKGRKEYRTVIQLGITTDTDDIEGTILSEKPVPEILQGQVEEALALQTGCIRQIPPAVSAIHVEGRRAYDLVRSGKPVNLEPRSVVVYKISLVELALPYLTLAVECGPGTYIRSIARDLGASLGTGAVVKELRRTRSGAFFIENTVTLEQVAEAASDNSLQSIFINPMHVLSYLPQITINESASAKVRNGGTVYRDDISGMKPGEELAATQEVPGRCGDERTGITLVLDPAGTLLAVARQVDENTFAPEKVFAGTQ